MGKNNNGISGVVLFVIAIAVILFVLKAADGSLDFYGSIGFDMFEDRSPFNDDKDKRHYDHDDDDDRKLTVKVKTDYEGNIKVKAGGETDTINGEGKTTLRVDDDVKKVCISAQGKQYCQKINEDVTIITFNLRNNN